MKPRLTISAKVFLLAIGNFVLVGLVFVVFVVFTFGSDLASFFFAPARERIMAVSRQFAADLEQTPTAELGELTARYAREHRVAFYVFANEGKQFAGDPIQLPPEVSRELSRTPQGRPGGGPPPGGRGGGPPPPPPLVTSGAMPGPPLPTQLPFFVVSDSPLPYWIGIRIPVRNLDNPIIAPGTLFLVSRTLLGNPFVLELGPWLAILGGSALISVVCWYPLVRRMTRTIGQMMQATSKISEGDFSAHVKAKGSDELGLLGASINRMASRLETFVKGQKRFLGDVAHELRSPLGRMQVGAAILQREGGEALSKRIGGLQEEIEMMSDLTNQLLAFARAELRPDSVPLVPTRVAQVVNRAVAVEAGSGEAVHVDVSPELQALAEPEYLFRCVSNLIRNSIRYAGDAGPIEVTAETRNGHVLISVADSGPGVPEAALEKIFEPFYRVDDARDRRSGGTGLGLAIVRSCVEACHGSVECHNRKPSGLVVTIRFARA